MKKYSILLTATAMLMAGIVIAGKLTKTPETPVRLYTLEPQLMEQTVTCSGKIEPAESKNLYTEVSCVAEQLFVKAGDKVRKGDVLFTVDVDATKEVLASVGGLPVGSIPTDRIKKEVIAPVGGVIATLNVEQGKLTDSAKPCAVISSTDGLLVKIAIHENNIKNVKVGQPAVVSGSAFRRAQYTGELSYISPSARQQYVGSVAETVVDAMITLSPDQIDDSLRLGLSAKAKVILGSTPDALIVPYEAVLQDKNNQEYVYVYRDGYAVKTPITTAAELSTGFHVTAGVSAGDRIILEPETIPRDGAPVAIEE